MKPRPERPMVELEPVWRGQAVCSECQYRGRWHYTVTEEAARTASALDAEVHAWWHRPAEHETDGTGAHS